jgi:hypothetical protein
VGTGPCDGDRTMLRRTRTQVSALLLALLLALGSGLALVHGSLMAAELAVAGEACHAGPNGCDDGHDCATDADTCLALCVSAAQGVLPAEPIAAPPASRAAFDAVALIPGGRTNSPEHGPPKLLAPAAA